MPSTVIPYDPLEAFRRLVMEACVLLSASPHTRRAYLADAGRWIEFCRENDVRPEAAEPIHVAAWVESMRHEGFAPKTRGRRVSSLSSIYRHLKRDGRVERNVFSAEDGPKREPTPANRPTPIAETGAVLAALRCCEEAASSATAPSRSEGMRDAAIMRVLWATASRRSSLVQITRERLVFHSDDGSYTCEVPAKGGKMVRLWFGGRAASAVTRWLARLDEMGIVGGPIFRRLVKTRRPMTERDVWEVVSRRGEEGGGKLTPHSFRVAFLTLNPAALDERQDAAGHEKSDTTRGYERTWRGQRAFMLMPEVEDAFETETSKEKR